MEPVEPTEPVDATRQQGPSSEPVTPVSHWATTPPAEVPATPPPVAERPRPALLLVTWVAALILAGFFAVLTYRAGGGSEAYRFGRAVGTFAVPFMFALVLRLVWVRVLTRSRPLPRPVLRSPWVPFGAVILIGLNLVGNASSLLPPKPVEPASAIRISGPFSLRPASAETEAIAAAGFKGDRSITSYEVREVVGDDGSLSLLVIADGQNAERTGAIEGVARGIESASGLTATIQTIRERRVAIAVGDTLSIGGWIEEPFGIYVYAVTPTRLEQIIESILDAPRSGT